MASLPILQLLKRQKENIINKFMPINWTNSLKDTKLSKLTQEQTDNLNSPYLLERLNLELKIVTQITVQADSFSGKLLQTLKEEIIPNLYKLSQKIEEERTLPKAFYEATITLV